MSSGVLRACLVLAVLAHFAARSAHAQPALTAPIPPPAVAPRYTIELAAAAGSTYDGDLYAGGVLAGGYRINDLISLHAALETATARILHFPGVDQYEGTTDRFSEARGGLELRTCRRGDALCAVGGVDLGFRDETVTGDQPMGLSGAEAVARIGLDLGTRRVRVRPMFEGTSTHHGDTGALLLGLAYRL